MRIDKILAHLGYGSRKNVKKLMKSLQIEVNGEKVKDAKYNVNTEMDRLSINGETVIYKQHVYYMMNKPAGVISATEDKSQRTVLDLINPIDFRKDLFPVGRLDKDTTGLLLITNDGELAHRLLSPKNHVAKKYWASIDGRVTEADVTAFKKGVVLGDGYETLPAKLKILQADNRSEIEVIIEEGKYHQIKRMFLSRGKKVLLLKRLEMGCLQLDEQLVEGHYRVLSETEIHHLNCEKV